MAQAGKGVKRRELTDEEITAEVERTYEAVVRGYWRIRESCPTEVETADTLHRIVLNTGMHISNDERVLALNEKMAQHVVHLHNEFVKVRRGEI